LFISYEELFSDIEYDVMSNSGYLLLTPWCRTLFEKLIVTQPVKNIPPSYGIRRFITVFKKARHRTLSWASRIQFASWIPISERSVL